MACRAKLALGGDALATAATRISGGGSGQRGLPGAPWDACVYGTHAAKRIGDVAAIRSSKPSIIAGAIPAVQLAAGKLSPYPPYIRVVLS